MKKFGVRIALLLVLGLLTILFQRAPVAGQTAVNEVDTQFATNWAYSLDGDTFTNSEVNGQEWWKASGGNHPDETGQPVTALELRLDSGLPFDAFPPPPPTTIAPPTYRWSFGDVPEGAGVIGHVTFTDPDASPVTFTPGFDASRSVDVTQFSGPDTQTLTITVTPRQVMERLGINVAAPENDLVNAVITSPTSGDDIDLSPDGHFLRINPTGLPLNTPWTITVTIQVTPKVPNVEFVPTVVVSTWDEPLASGTTTGSSVSHTVDGMGTWTWSAQGSYEWQWREQIVRHVDFPSHSTEVVEPVPIEGQVASCGAVELVWGFRNDTKRFNSFAPAFPAASNLTVMIRGSGYWIRTNGDCTLTFGSSSYALYDGWNLIGWLESEVAAVAPGNEAGASQAEPPIAGQLGACADQVTTAWGYDNQAKEWLGFEPGAPGFLQTLNEFVAGGGYWVSIEGDCDLEAPTITHKLYDGWNLIGWVD